MDRNCKRCGHSWKPRKPVSVICPNCRSPYWNSPRVNKKKGGKLKC